MSITLFSSSDQAESQWHIEEKKHLGWADLVAINSVASSAGSTATMAVWHDSHDSGPGSASQSIECSASSWNIGIVVYEKGNIVKMVAYNLLTALSSIAQCQRPLFLFVGLPCVLF